MKRKKKHQKGNSRRILCKSRKTRKFKPDRQSQSSTKAGRFPWDLGYKVGAHGLPKRQRQEILEQALFLENIPIDHDDGSMPGSKQRFKKITNSLQWLINSKKVMKNDAYQYSIKDWQDDLNWFIDKFD